MRCIRSFITAAIVLAVVPAMAQKSIPLVYDQEFTGAKYAEPAYPSVDEAKTLETLPNPFEFSDGKKKALDGELLGLAGGREIVVDRRDGQLALAELGDGEGIGLGPCGRFPEQSAQPT